MGNVFMNILWLFYWLMAALLDWNTYYIPPFVLMIGIGIAFAVAQNLYWLSLIYPLICLGLYVIRRQSIGYADAVALLQLAMVYDPYTMNKIVLAAVLSGFLIFLFSERKMIPFVTCLTVGVLTATMI